MPTAKALKRTRYHQIRDGARSPNGEISPDEQVAIKKGHLKKRNPTYARVNSVRLKPFLISKI
jgi:hypothetical protein